MTDNFEVLKIKEDFNKYNFSFVFSVINNNRINVIITDRQEKKIYCGISSKILML